MQTFDVVTSQNISAHDDDDEDDDDGGGGGHGNGINHI